MYDVIVSNPPYSLKWDNTKYKDDDRFCGVLAPNKCMDLAFIQHGLHLLSGVASYIVFPGVLYRGGAEQKIRELFIRNNMLDCVISCPAGCFIGTNIAVVILKFKRYRENKDVFFIDASNYVSQQGKILYFSDNNIEEIKKIVEDRQDIKNVARKVSAEEIEKNNWCLSVNQYVEKEDIKEKIDIVALEKEIEELKQRRRYLEDKLDEMIKNEFGGTAN